MPLKTPRDALQVSGFLEGSDLELARSSSLRVRRREQREMARVALAVLAAAALASAFGPPSSLHAQLARAGLQRADGLAPSRPACARTASICSLASS